MSAFCASNNDRQLFLDNPLREVAKIVFKQLEEWERENLFSKDNRAIKVCHVFPFSPVIEYEDDVANASASPQALNFIWHGSKS
jgi:hypothetical protein